MNEFHPAKSILHIINTTPYAPIFHIRPSPFFTPMAHIHLDPIRSQFPSFQQGCSEPRLGLRTVRNRGSHRISYPRPMGWQRRGYRLVREVVRRFRGVGVAKKFGDGQTSNAAISLAVFAVTFAGIRLVGIVVLCMIARGSRLVVQFVFAAPTTFKHGLRSGVVSRSIGGRCLGLGYHTDGRSQGRRCDDDLQRL